MTEGMLERLLTILISESDKISTEHAAIRIRVAAALAEVCQSPGWMETGRAALNGHANSRDRVCEKAQAVGFDREWELARMIVNAENGDTNYNEGH